MEFPMIGRGTLGTPAALIRAAPSTSRPGRFGHSAPPRVRVA